MNCHQFRKYLFAFADGQIDIKSNCDLLDHLKMCERCSRIVDQQQTLKALLVASAMRSRVPAGLEARIRAAIEPPARSKKKAANALSLLGNRRVLRVTALAACVVIVFTGLWFAGLIGPGASLRDGRAIASGAYDAEDADIKMRSVVVQHNKCVERCNEQIHQLSGLSGDRETAVRELGERLGEQVAIAAPDLSGFGYEFESAAVCSPSRDIHGATAHFMYVNHAYGTRLSFFSVPHWGAADALLADKTFRDPFAYTPAGNCQSQSVVAWNSGTTTYLVCAPINQEDLVQMIREFAISLPGEVSTRH
ncbi:MAG: zf-HC2 domain-containing protein [Phycisphaerales bacterium]|nr:zf-HC2 domain-containing protein [Phycisphaerales bacterium]